MLLVVVMLSEELMNFIYDGDVFHSTSTLREVQLLMKVVAYIHKFIKVKEQEQQIMLMSECYGDGNLEDARDKVVEAPLCGWVKVNYNAWYRSLSPPVTDFNLVVDGIIAKHPRDGHCGGRGNVV